MLRSHNGLLNRLDPSDLTSVSLGELSLCPSKLVAITVTEQSSSAPVARRVPSFHGINPACWSRAGRMVIAFIGHGIVVMSLAANNI
ncbi:hypothetical protein Q5Y75_16945 [Ruegeria sp. 2205SS24-7]|uniref:hypothetical protein n=1 Tax=Ruegeria discodermiae TaxID=3064389 RepID=UPI00274076E2|nr:hypothetical protein [Ruegeria sp. 2205SS24-7]MDP5218910.1 hypothetical protein [Ruegeria sp. 2205SS24-7]